MKNNKHMDFLEKIKMPESRTAKKENSKEHYRGVVLSKAEQEELERRKELVRRLEELFGAGEEN
ncbi:MAG: hypothetical protein ACOYBL_09630 [Lachnospiraceae bacterium]